MAFCEMGVGEMLCMHLMHADAGRALVAVTNARIRGEDASPRKLLSLISLALRGPAQHTSGIFWGVQTAPGAQQLSENVRLAIYGAALQTVIVDLLSGESSVRSLFRTWVPTDS